MEVLTFFNVLSVQRWVSVGLFLVLILSPISAFKPDRLSAGEDFSHETITRLAAKRFIYRHLVITVSDISGSAPLSDSQIDSSSELTIFSRFYAPESVATKLSERFSGAVDSIVKENSEMSSRPGERRVAKLHFYSEQINEGNAELFDLKTRINNKIAEEDWQTSRLLIGRYFHTLQDFYSSTNWVETRSEPGTLPDTLGTAVGWASTDRCFSWFPTCTSDCKANTCTGTERYSGLVREIKCLTSGYFKGATDGSPDDSVIPKLVKDKCNHGGRSDGYNSVPPYGGINKESFSVVDSPSPANTFHQEAASRAIKATETYLMELKLEHDTATADDASVIVDLFNQRYQESLAIVMDDTGSMSEEIRAAKQASKDIVEDYAGDGTNSLLQLILVVFNDPAVRLAANTNDKDVFNRALDSLSAGGGGDTPEYSLSGIRLALETCEPGSNIFVFTDAPAKDSFQKEDVLSLAQAKDIKVNFLLTDVLSTSRRRRKKRVTPVSFYADLSHVSGGVTIYTTSSDIGSAVDIIKDILSTEKWVNIYSSEMITSPTSHTFVLDSSVTEIRLQLTAASIAATVAFSSLSNASGEVTLTQKTTLDNIKVATLLLPSAGLWTLSVTCTDSCDLSVQGRSSIEFIYDLREPVVTDSGETVYTTLPRRPTVGSQIAAAVALTPEGSAGVASVDHLVLESAEGEELVRCAPDTLAELLYGCLGVEVPAQDFRLVVFATDKSGARIQRQSPDLITPTLLQINAPSTFYEVAANSTLNLELTLNSTVESETFAVTWNSPSYVVMDNSVQLSSGSVVVPIQVSAPPDIATSTLLPVRFEFTSTLDESFSNSKVINFLLVNSTTYAPSSDTEPPNCTVTESTYDTVCNTDLAGCQLGHWSATFLLSDTGSGLSAVSKFSGESEVVLVGAENLNGSSSAIVQTSADCCTRYFLLDVADSSGNSQTCAAGNLSAIGSSPSILPTELFSCKKGQTDRTTDDSDTLCTHCVGYYFYKSGMDFQVHRGCIDDLPAPQKEHSLLETLECPTTSSAVGVSHCEKSTGTVECLRCCQGNLCNRGFTSSVLSGSAAMTPSRLASVLVALIAVSYKHKFC